MQIQEVKSTNPFFSFTNTNKNDSQKFGFIADRMILQDI